MRCLANLCVPGKSVPPEDQARNKLLTKLLARATREDSYKKKLLFLGTGASGKSTFMKQIIQNYGTGFSDDEKTWWKRKAATNVIEALQILCEESISMKDDPEYKCNADDDDDFYDGYKRLRDIVTKSKSKSQTLIFNSLDAKVIYKLWKHPLIQFGYDNRGHFPFDFGDIEYFFHRVSMLADPEYQLSHADITYVRSKTNGVYEQTVTIEGVNFTFIDVAGQRSSRNKWIACFSDVTAVIWVSALDNYNEVLFENENVNAMDDALEAFEWAVTHPMLEKPIFALFLNKIDSLEKKIKKNSKKFGLKRFFDDYDGADGDTEAAAEFLKDVFLSCVPEEREIPSYIVQATDPTNANKVLHGVIFGLLNNEMAKTFG